MGVFFGRASRTAGKPAQSIPVDNLQREASSPFSTVMICSCQGRSQPLSMSGDASLVRIYSTGEPTISMNMAILSANTIHTRPSVMVQPVGVWILGCEGFDSIVIPRDMVHRILVPVMRHSLSIYCVVLRIAGVRNRLALPKRSSTLSGHRDSRPQ